LLAGLLAGFLDRWLGGYFPKRAADANETQVTPAQKHVVFYRKWPRIVAQIAETSAQRLYCCCSSWLAGSICGFDYQVHLQG
jgi:hypothetical protein